MVIIWLKICASLWNAAKTDWVIPKQAEFFLVRKRSYLNTLSKCVKDTRQFMGKQIQKLELWTFRHSIIKITIIRISRTIVCKCNCALHITFSRRWITYEMCTYGKTQNESCHHPVYKSIFIHKQCREKFTHYVFL